MKFIVFALCILIVTPHDVVLQDTQASVADLLTWLEIVTETEGTELITKAVTLLKHVEDGIMRVKEILPEVNKKVHEDADRVLNEVREIVKDLKDFLIKKDEDLYYGLGILDDLSSLTGGFKLSTALRVLQLAESAHKVCQDAKEFEPKLEKEFDKIQGIFEKHVSDLTTHLISELGLSEPQNSIALPHSNDVERSDGKFWPLVVRLINAMQDGIERVKELVPEIYKKVHNDADKVLDKIKEIIRKFKDFVSNKNKEVFYRIEDFDSITDFIGNFKLSTAIRILKLADSAHKVIRDAKEFQPHLEKELDKVLGIIEKHVEDIASHVGNESGLRFVRDRKSEVSTGLKHLDEIFYELVTCFLKQLEESIRYVKKVVSPIKDEADKILIEIEKIAADLKDFFFKKNKNYYYGYGIVDTLSELTGGFKLSTAIRVLQLAESAHKICKDAKEFEPKLEGELNKIQKIIEKHVETLATHVVDEFGLDKKTVHKGVVRNMNGLSKQLDESVYRPIVYDIESPSQGSYFRSVRGTLDEIKKELKSLALDLLKEIENIIQRVKEMVPETNEKIQKEADEILNELKEVIEDVKSWLSKEAKTNADAQYGLGILDDLTDSLGGFKLSTALRILQLAESARKVCQDAKEFEPNLEKEFDKMQGILEKHVSNFTKHLFNKLGLGKTDVQKSIVKDIEALMKDAKKTVDKLILDLFENIEDCLGTLEKELPEVYHVVEQRVTEIRTDIRNILQELIDTLQFGATYGILDIAGTLTKGTTIGKVIRIVIVIEKFNTVIQDVRGFGPHVEVFLNHSVRKVAASAGEFMIRAADLMLSK